MTKIFGRKWLSALASSGNGYALLSALAAFALFAPTLNYGFVWDDADLIGWVGRTVSTEGGLSLLTSGFMLEESATGFYRPVAVLSLWLDSLAAKAVPTAFHLTNVLLHSFTTFMVFFLARRLGAGQRSAFFGALLFAAHPVHVESVAWVSGRTDLLSAFFCMASALAWFEAKRPGRDTWSKAGFAAFLWLAALLSKENALALPLVFLVYSAVSPREGEKGLKVFGGKWVGLFGAVFAGYCALRFSVAGVGSAESDLFFKWGVAEYFLAWLKYLRLMIFPWPLVPYYPERMMAFNLPDLLGATLTLGVFFLAVRGRGRQLVCLAWAVLFLLPASGIVSFGGAVVAERYLYLPSVGFAIAAGALYGRSAEWSARASVAVSLVVLLLFGGLSLHGSSKWKSNVDLYGHMAETSGASKVYYMLGIEQMNSGSYKEASEAFTRVTELSPDSPDGWYSLGASYGMMGDHPKAIGFYGEALKFRPGDPAVLKNLGISQGQVGQFKGAAESFRKALRKLPFDAELRFNLGVSLLSLGDNAGAAAQFQKALELNPRYGQARDNLNYVKGLMGRGNRRVQR